MKSETTTGIVLFVWPIILFLAVIWSINGMDSLLILVKLIGSMALTLIAVVSFIVGLCMAFGDDSSEGL